MKLEPTNREITDAPRVDREPKARRTNARAAIRLAWLLGLIGSVLALLGLILLYASYPARFIDFVPYSVQFLAFLIVGTIVASRRPDNAISWIFLVVGLANLIWVFAGAYTAYALVTQPGALPLSDWIIWLGTGWLPGLGWGLMATFGLLLFPTGQLHSRRWQPVAWVAATVLVIFTLTNALAPGPVDAERLGSIRNPFGVEALAGLGEIMLLLTLPVVIASVASVILRFRRARGDERQQLKWFAYTACLFIFALLLGLANEILGRPLPELVIGMAFFVPVAGLPISVGIAILKYRLYNIDLIINRTLVYVPLTAVLAGVYAVLDELLERLFLSITGSSSDAATVLTTLIIAVSFTPVKNGIQDFVDKRFKEAPDATRKLVGLGQEVEARIYPVNVRQVTRRLLERAAAAYGVKAGAFHLQQAGRTRLIHTWGEWKEAEAVISISLACNGERLGVLQLGARRNGLDYSEEDRATLQQVADAVACAIKEDAEDYLYVPDGDQAGRR